MSPQSFREKIFRSSGWSLIGTFGRQMFGFLVFVILSRLLSPIDFGLFAVALAFIETISILVRLGITENLVCEAEIDDETASTVFWLALGAGIAVSLVLLVAAPAIAIFFGSSQMEGALRWLSVVPLLQASTTVHEARLQKAFRYQVLAMRTLSATIFSGVVSIGMAYWGAGLYSLVFQRVSSALIINGIVFASVPWLPSLSFSPMIARDQLSKGGHLLLSGFVSIFKIRVTDMIIGYFLGPAATGYYKIAGKLNDFLVQVLIEPIVSVSLPTFSSLRGDRRAMIGAYRKLTMLCGVFTFPIFMGNLVLATDVTVFLFGRQWETSGTLMQILCLACFSSTLDYFFRPFAIATGQQSLVSVVNIIQFVVVVLTTLATAQIGISAVVIGYVVSSTIVTLFEAVVLKRQMDVEYDFYPTAFLAPVVSSLTMAAAVWWLKRVGFATPTPWVGILALAAAGAVVYCGVLRLVFPAYFRMVTDLILPMLMNVFRRAKA